MWRFLTYLRALACGDLHWLLKKEYLACFNYIWRWWERCLIPFFITHIQSWASWCSIENKAKYFGNALLFFVFTRFYIQLWPWVWNLNFRIFSGEDVLIWLFWDCGRDFRDCNSKESAICPCQGNIELVGLGSQSSGLNLYLLSVIFSIK